MFTAVATETSTALRFVTVPYVDVIALGEARRILRGESPRG